MYPTSYVLSVMSGSVCSGSPLDSAVCDLPGVSGSLECRSGMQLWSPLMYSSVTL